MRRIPGFILIFSLALTTPAFAANSNLKVVVQNPSGTPIEGANVAAMHFNDGKPDPLTTVIGRTDSSGVLFFDGSPIGIGVTSTLTATNVYQIVASSQGYLPTFIQQFRNPPSVTASAPVSTSPVTVTIVISTGGASNLGEVDTQVVNATTGSIVFGQLGLQSGGGAVAYGITNIDNTGTGQMQFLNVTYAAANVYQIGAFDASQNRAAGANISGVLNAGSSPLSAPNLDFAQARPPVANIGQAQSSGSGGGLSVYGVVVDTNNAAIPYMQLNFQSQHVDSLSNSTINDWRGAQSDENGVFQLYNLNAGSTYYAFIFGGCNQNSGTCYKGYQSTAAPSGVPAANDFLYTSSTTVLYPRIVLQTLPPGSGAISVYVTDQSSNPFFQAGVGLFPDGIPHQLAGGASCTGPYIPNPGFKNANTQAATGYALLTGLPSGNYQLNVWTPYGQTTFNAGSDGKQNFNSCSSGDTDDIRLTIDTSSVSGVVSLWDQYGNLLSSGTSSVNVTVKVPTGTLTGLIKGTLTFPSVVDLSSSPVSLVLYPQCSGGGPCGGGGFTGFSSASTGPVINYAIPVSSGQSYFMQVISDYWGAVFPGGNQPQPNLTQTSTAVVNMNFFPAGRITGYMRKPDGSIYVPPTGNGGNAPAVNAEGKNSWGYNQIAADGSFSLGGLLPGDYTLAARANGGSQFPYTAKLPAPNLTVSANQTITQDLYLTDAVTAVPLVSTSSLPPLNVLKCAQNSQGDCPPENWKVYALPQGTPMTPDIVSNLLGGGNGEAPGLFSFYPSTGQANGNGCNGENLSSPGFCSQALAASKSGSAFDFYLMRMGGFDSANMAGGVRPHFVIESSTKNIIVGNSYLNATRFSSNGGGSGSTTSVQNLPLTPSPSLAGTLQATLSGTVTATNMINRRQFNELAGNFDAFLKYLPLVWAYDSSGTLKAVGLVVPSPPAEKPFDAQLNQAVASGNYSSFQTLTGAAPSGWGALGYEIRGLTAGKFYNLVVTTPNYPPYKTSVTLGAAGSTTTVNADLDSNPGTSMSGVVTTTSSVAIGGAQVTVKAPGYIPTTLVTDSSGAWSLSGLGAGRYNVQATAAGYAQGAQDVDVNATAVTVPTFKLNAVNASLSGTVYTNNPICPAGATCSAFGKTVLQGITVLAYDDTQNVQSPTAALSLYRAVTDSSGTFTIKGLSTSLISGSTSYHSFKVFANAPGYYVLNQSTEVRPGNTTGFDFNLSPKPLDVNVYGHQVGANYEFQITNYKDFSSGSAYVSQSPFGGKLAAGTTDVSTSPGFVERPDASGATQLFMDIPLAPLTTGVTYVLHIEAQPNDPSASAVIKEVQFGKGLPHGVCQSVDQALIGDESGTNTQGLPNNSLPLDISGGADGNGSNMSMPTGAVIPTLSTAIPTMCMTETDASASSLVTSSLRTSGVTLAAFLSGVYNVSLTSVNYTAKGVDLTLSYNQTGADLNDLGVYSYDSVNQKWNLVPGLQTIDPVKGTISVKGLKSLASVLSLQQTGPGVASSGGGGGGSIGMMALSDGHGYRPNARTSAVTDSGQFAVLKPSQVNGGAYSGTTIRIYNFPNPFDLQSKTLTLPATENCAGGSSILTNGTVIKYEIPGGISGHAVIRLYTLAGRLVRELDGGTVAANTCYATQWDGKNRNGQPVSNGVYYGLLSIGGKKQSSGTFKLAVIK